MGRQEGRETDMLYDRPVRELLAEAVKDLPQPFTRDDVDRWFDANYPRVKHSTIQAHLTAGSVNDRNRLHYTMDVGDLLFKRSDGRFERYDAARHGWWTDGRLTQGAPDGQAVPEELQEPWPEAASTQRAPKAVEMLGEALGCALQPSVLRLEGGPTQRFDFVSEDEHLVGFLVDGSASSPAETRWTTITDRVWLLQHLRPDTRKLLVFADDTRTPRVWLDNLGALADDIDFLILDGRRLVDLREIA